MSQEGTPKASDILRRREDRTTKLQKAIDRGQPRSYVGEVTETKAPGQGRPVKPIRITVDLSASQHRFLREFTLDTGTKGTQVLRGLLAELAEDDELRERLTQRLKQ
jgi:predicted transcriptional regulator